MNPHPLWLSLDDSFRLSRSIKFFEQLSDQLSPNKFTVLEIRALNQDLRMELWNMAKGKSPYCFFDLEAPAYKKVIDAYRCSYTYLFGHNEGRVLLIRDSLHTTIEHRYCCRTWSFDRMLQWCSSKAVSLNEVRSNLAEVKQSDLSLQRVIAEKIKDFLRGAWKA